MTLYRRSSLARATKIHSRISEKNHHCLDSALSPRRKQEAVAPVGTLGWLVTFFQQLLFVQVVTNLFDTLTWKNGPEVPRMRRPRTSSSCDSVILARTYTLARRPSQDEVSMHPGGLRFLHRVKEVQSRLFTSPRP